MDDCAEENASIATLTFVLQNSYFFHEVYVGHSQFSNDMYKVNEPEQKHNADTYCDVE